MLLRDLVASGATHLKKAGIPEPLHEAESLLGYVLGRDEAWILAHPETPIGPTYAQRFRNSIGKRAHRVPFAYVVGEKWFYGRPFDVTEATLIPRPETETLVEAVLAAVDKETQATILDIGTGSGAIGLSLAAALPMSKTILYDVSGKALAVARTNAKRLKLEERARAERLDILRADVPVPGRRPVIIAANLPYLPVATWEKAQPEVRKHEPKLALVSGEDGLRHYHALYESLARWKRPPELLAIEAEPEQFAELREMTTKLMPEADIRVLKDLHGDDRVLIAKNENAST